METGWGHAFKQHLEAFEDDVIITVLTRDNREFFAHPNELVILDTFPTAWIVSDHAVIPESEIIRAEVSGQRREEE